MEDTAASQRTEAGWEQGLSAALSGTVRVTYGRSRTRVVQASWERGVLRLRLHELFRSAPDPIAADLASWLQHGKRARAACARLDAWIDGRLAALPAARAPRTRPRARGEHHDLETLAAELWTTSFAASSPGPSLAADERPALTWGRRGRRRVRHTLRLGSFEPVSRLVRVHPVLDQPAVPAWFVRYLLFHELLHAALPARTRADGRQVHHGPDFRHWERRYPDYDRALRWQEQWIGTLIRSARSGKSVPRSAWAAMGGRGEGDGGGGQLLLF